MPKPSLRSAGGFATWRHTSARIRSSASGRARIAIISDTHGHPHPKSPGLVTEMAPDAILHAGDVGDLRALDPFRPIAPLHVVRGNIDTRADALPDSIDIEVVDADGQRLVKLLLQHICVRGPKLLAAAAKNAKDHGADVVVCGHSHVPFIGRDRDLLVFNPGSIGPRRFTLPIVYGTLELADGRASMQHISCETGARWLPPR